MLSSRIIVAIILIPILVLAVIVGGLFFLGVVCLMLGLAAWEFGRLFEKGGYSPAHWVLVSGSVLIAAARYFWGFQYSDIILAGLTLLTLAFHTFRYKEGEQTSAVDFSITMGGLMYIGWLGSYLISIRQMDDGFWWVMLAIPAISVGDAGAFFTGHAFGRHKLAPKVSPNKTIEGYIGGIIFTIIGGLGLAYLWGLRTPVITLEHGLILGIVLGVLAPVGDLVESMLKRQFGVKDSGKILAAHGGMMDRLDSWIWGGVISYYLILWLK